MDYGSEARGARRHFPALAWIFPFSSWCRKRWRVTGGFSSSLLIIFRPVSCARMDFLYGLLLLWTGAGQKQQQVRASLRVGANEDAEQIVLIDCHWLSVKLQPRPQTAEDRSETWGGGPQTEGLQSDSTNQNLCCVGLTRSQDSLTFTF